MIDNSNAELGIAVSQAKAAQNKLDHARGFERQHEWSIQTLDERIFGLFVTLVLVIFLSAWLFDIPPLIRYAVTILCGGIFVYLRSMATKRQKDLDALRQQQVQDHAKKAFAEVIQRD